APFSRLACRKNSLPKLWCYLNFAPLASGATIQDIVEKYPHLTSESIKEAILYASNFMANEILIEIESPINETE
ncbi:MAG: DUF433 domain-containing protein, partial [Lewinella sp.]|nr:DUF433 domain-containing protein [Lewinella sp.]